jgi:hypothetical protein
MTEQPTALITNDAVVLEITIGLVFITSSSEKPYYKNSTVLSHRYYYAILFQQFSTPSILYLVETSVYTQCLALFITCKFSVTHIEYQFCCFKRLGSKAVIMFF